MSSVVGRLALLVATGLLLAGCASVDPVVKVGLAAPFEGRHRTIGYDAIYSARLAVREINAAGGINGHRIALVALDDNGQPELAAQTAASLSVDPSVLAVVGHYLPETTAAGQQVYERDGLAHISVGEPPFGPRDPGQLSPEFREAYAAVSPFDEEAGPYAGSTYDAFQLLWRVLAEAEAMDRPAVLQALRALE